MYGIDRSTVDAKLEIEHGCIVAGKPCGSDLLASLDGSAPVGRDLAQVSVERERLVAMVHDDEPSVPGERVGIRHRAVVHGVHGCTLRRLNLDAAQWRTA